MTIVDVRRMYDSLQFQSLPLLNSQIVEQTAQIAHSVKADVSKMAADLCKKGKDVDADKRVRFKINVDNNERQQHNNDRTAL